MKKLIVLFSVSLIIGIGDGSACLSGLPAQKRNASAMNAAPDSAIAPDDPFDSVVEKIVYLDQNWTMKERNEFYTLTQGSRLIPYDWFLHLEQTKSDALFRNASNMNRYRYLIQRVTQQNPHGLPVGFVKDPKNVGDKSDWLGLTCAACHTSQIHYKKVAYRIDGGPAMADHDQFLIDLTAALRATAADNVKFERFAKKVSNGNVNKELKSELEAFIKQRESYNERNKTDVQYGYARLDAFGRIMNEVMTRHIGLGNENAKSPNAPVSYPHLWDTPRYDMVQWNGVAHNNKLFGPLGRNAGEVLGVFGSVTVSERTIENRYDPRFKSSVNLTNLRILEQSVSDLWSPRWPTAFGKLNAIKVEAGKKLFDKHCAKCHTTDMREIDPEDPSRSFKASLHSLKDAGTDPRMAMNFVLREGGTGNMKGRRFFDPKKGLVNIREKEKAGVLLLALVNGTILGADREDRIALIGEALEHLNDQIKSKKIKPFEGWEKFLSLKPYLALKMPDNVNSLRSLDEDLLKVMSEIHRGKMGEAPLHYKAGALNGVWATAPYLHNGSVPNLWELLLPPVRRTKRFEVGSREFDPKLVGFKTTGYEARGGFVLDATIAGNLNGGHDYTKQLTDDDRWTLLEYLKSI